MVCSGFYKGTKYTDIQITKVVESKVVEHTKYGFAHVSKQFHDM